MAVAPAPVDAPPRGDPSGLCPQTLMPSRPCGLQAGGRGCGHRTCRSRTAAGYAVAFSGPLPGGRVSPRGNGNLGLRPCTCCTPLSLQAWLCAASPPPHRDSKQMQPPGKAGLGLPEEWGEPSCRLPVLLVSLSAPQQHAQACRHTGTPVPSQGVPASPICRRDLYGGTHALETFPPALGRTGALRGGPWHPDLRPHSPGSFRGWVCGKASGLAVPTACMCRAKACLTQSRLPAQALGKVCPAVCTPSGLRGQVT